VRWDSLLAPYYGNGTARHIAEPVGTITTRDRWALVSGIEDIDINDVLYRMLEPHEIGAGMGFAPDYTVLGTSKRVRVKQYGGAVTPNVAEVIVSALVEAITGEDLDTNA
jgi:DNA (cytosine-5)-methyltransferase 1